MSSKYSIIRIYLDILFLYSYSAIFAQFMPAEYIQRFICCIFKQMNIFGYSFNQYFAIEIYLDIQLWWKKMFTTHWVELTCLDDLPSRLLDLLKTSWLPALGVNSSKSKRENPVRARRFHLRLEAFKSEEIGRKGHYWTSANFGQQYCWNIQQYRKKLFL